MKYLLFALLFVSIISCKEDDETNALKKHQDIRNELFNEDNLQTITFKLVNDTLITGKRGTTLFLPKNLFENYSGGLITLRFKEFYSKEDMLQNGLSTLTDKGELLESSGMFYINFLESDKQLKIKSDQNYIVSTQQNIKPGSRIYNVKNESLFEWSLNEEPIYVRIPDALKNYQFGIAPLDNGVGGYFKEVLFNELDKIISEDSLKIAEIIQKDSINRQTHRSITTTVFEFRSSSLGWINIDLLLKQVEENDFMITSKNADSDYLSVFVIYSDYNSMYDFAIEDFNGKSKKSFKIIGSGKIIFLYKQNEKVYFDQWYFNEEIKNFEIDLNFKEVSLSNLKKEIITN